MAESQGWSVSGGGRLQWKVYNIVESSYVASRNWVHVFHAVMYNGHPILLFAWISPSSDERFRRKAYFLYDLALEMSKTSLSQSRVSLKREKWCHMLLPPPSPHPLANGAWTAYYRPVLFILTNCHTCIAVSTFETALKECDLIVWHSMQYKYVLNAFL